MTYAVPDGDPGGQAAEAAAIRELADRAEDALIEFCRQDGDFDAAVKAVFRVVLAMRELSDQAAPAVFEAETRAQLAARARRRYPVPASRGCLHVVPGPH